MEETRKKINDLGDHISREFPGVGFTVILFPFNSIGEANYISNAQRSDMIKGLDEMLHRFRGQEENENKIVDMT